MCCVYVYGFNSDFLYNTCGTGVILTLGSAHMHSASGQLASYRARKEKQINKEEIILGESGCQVL